MARELGLELDQPASVNDEQARARIAAAAPEAVCVCAFGALIKEPLLSDYEMLNVHPSLLPRWRGAAPVERAIMAGDERDRGVDHAASPPGSTAARCVPRSPTPIEPEDTYGTLAERLEGSARELLVDVLDRRPGCARAGRGRGHLRREADRRGPAARSRPAAPPSSTAWSGR